MKKRIVDSIARLASLELQRRFIVNGTIDRYLLPEELLEEAISVLKLTAANLDCRALVSDQEMTCIVSLLQFLEVESPKLPIEETQFSNAELIEQNESWLTIRNKAMECLTTFG